MASDPPIEYKSRDDTVAEMVIDILEVLDCEESATVFQLTAWNGKRIIISAHDPDIAGATATIVRDITGRSLDAKFEHDRYPMTNDIARLERQHTALMKRTKERKEKS